MLADSSKFIAQRAASQGCKVSCTEYKAMPHCFPFVFAIPQSRHTFEECARFCLTCVEDPSKLGSQAMEIDTSMKAHSVDIGSLVNLNIDEVKERMHQKRQDMANRYREKQGIGSRL